MGFSYPQHSHIEVSGECNLRCPMCPLKTRKRAGGFMEPAMLENIGKQSVRRMKQIFFSMFGEAAMHPDLPDMVRIAKKYWDWMSIESNGTLWSDKLLDDVMKAGATKLLLDCDTLDPKLYKETIRPGADLSRTIHNIESAIRIRDANNYPCRIEVQILNSKWNRNEIGAWLDFWESRINKTYDTLRIKHWDDWSDCDGRSDTYFKFINKPWIKGRHLYFGEESIDDPNITVVKPGTPLPACMWRRYETGITWDGYMVPCFRYCDYPEQGPLGHVSDGIETVWANAMKLYDSVDKGEVKESEVLGTCAKCTLRYFYASLADVTDRFRRRENL